GSYLGRAARADEEAGGSDEVAVGAHSIEETLRHHDPELRLERHRQLDEIERVGGQILTQRDPGDELFDTDAQMIGDQTSTRAFHEQLHPPSPQHCRDPSPLCADLHLPPSSVRALAEAAPGSLGLLCAW